jgi:hypothetical protein
MATGAINNPKDEDSNKMDNGFDSTGGSEFDPQDYEAANDARTLHSAEQIRSDPNRHQKAVAHLAHMKSSIVAAHANARRSLSRSALVKKTGNRLKEVYGKHGPEDSEEGETPFEKAGKNVNENK